MRRFFTVIGGMGTAATESYVRLLNARSNAQKDQDYMDYILVNHASVPDRTSYILDHTQENFYPYLKEDIEQQSLLKPEFMVMVCNTAHYFYDDLKQLTDIPLIHMPHTAIQEMTKRYPDEQRIGLIATKGTLADGIYANEIEATGRKVVLGDQQIQDMVMTLIYDNIKEHNRVDPELYHEILKQMHDRFGVNVIVLGCTELSLAQEKAPDHPYQVIDAQSIIVDKTLALGRAFREDETKGKALLADIMQ